MLSTGPTAGDNDVPVKQMADCAFNYPAPGNHHELRHHYGNNVHVLNDPLLLLMLSRMGHPGTDMHTARQLVKAAYEQMLTYVVLQEFPRKQVEVETRMREHAGSQGFYRGPVADLSNTVLVSIERGGRIPTESIADRIALASGGNVSVDSIAAERISEDGRVVGCSLSKPKIGGSVEGMTVVFADVMGATGITMETLYPIYTGRAPVPEKPGAYLGTPKQVIAVHLITAAEYVLGITQKCPGLIAYTARVDRGLSDPEVLKCILGSMKGQERGLNEHGYIVPGAGGMGEVLSGEAQRKPLQMRSEQPA